jgi:copper chaperone CopZ
LRQGAVSSDTSRAEVRRFRGGIVPALAGFGRSLPAAGYFGKSSDPAIKVNADTAAKNQQVKSITIEYLHLCCGKCVRAVNEALSGVPGVTGNTAATGESKSLEVTGRFNAKDVFDALQKAGLTGHEK